MVRLDLSGLVGFAGSISLGEIPGTSTTGAVDSTILVMLTSLVLLDRLEIAFTMGSTGSNVASTTVTIGMLRGSSGSWLLGAGTGAVYDIAVATTTSGQLEMRFVSRAMVNGMEMITYGCIGIMVSPGILADFLCSLAVTLCIARGGANIASTTPSRVRELRR